MSGIEERFQSIEYVPSKGDDVDWNYSCISLYLVSMGKSFFFFFTLCCWKKSSKNHNMRSQVTTWMKRTIQQMFVLSKENRTIQRVFTIRVIMSGLCHWICNIRYETHTLLKKRNSILFVHHKKMMKKVCVFFSHQIQSCVTNISENWGIFRNCVSNENSPFAYFVWVA